METKEEMLKLFREVEDVVEQWKSEMFTIMSPDDDGYYEQINDAIDDYDLSLLAKDIMKLDVDEFTQFIITLILFNKHYKTLPDKE